MWDRVRCVVLNATYEPLNIVSAKKALLNVFDGKAEAIEEHPTLRVHSVNRAWPIPTQIVLKYFVKSRPTWRIPAKLTPGNLWIRDKYTCQYCGRHSSQFKAHEKKTRDHIIPESRGGKDVWENVVLACSTCNHKKAGKLLSEINMKLRTKPHTPTIFEIWSLVDTKSLT